MEPVLYLQTDPRWASIPYAVKGETSTIKSAGCGPTCAAMVIATLADSSITPKETAKWALRNNFKALRQGTFYSYFVPQLKAFGIKATRVNTSSVYGQKTKAAVTAHERAFEAIKAGKLVICCMGKGNWTSSGHYILWYGLTGNGQAMLRDPASTASSRVRNKVALLQSQVKYYWIVDIPTAKPVPPVIEEDDEVIEKKKVDIFGKEYETDVIFKENRNFISPKVFEDAGLKVTSNGSRPMIDAGEVDVVVNGKKHKVPGYISNGTTYCGLRTLSDLLGVDVTFSKGTVVLKTRKEK